MRLLRALLTFGFLLQAGCFWCSGQRPEIPSIARDLDAANQSRFDKVLAFTDIEHYSVFRGKDLSHPAAELTVRMSYKKGAGKSYEILTQSGSALVRRYGLLRLLDNEKAINDPGRVAQSWFTTANYLMKVDSGGARTIDGRPCLALSISPYHKAPNLIQGKLWVDARDHTIVRVEGIASKSPSVFAGTTKMMRQYDTIEGYAMATRARAESSSALFGDTVVAVEYSDYHLTLLGAH